MVSAARKQHRTTHDTLELRLTTLQSSCLCMFGSLSSSHHMVDLSCRHWDAQHQEQIMGHRPRQPRSHSSTCAYYCPPDQPNRHRSRVSKTRHQSIDCRPNIRLVPRQNVSMVRINTFDILLSANNIRLRGVILFEYF